MTLSGDGTRLYVAASGSDGIIIIDTATAQLAEQRGWFWTGTSYGDPTCPRDVAWAAGQLWFSWGCPSSASRNIGRLDPQTGEFALNAASASYAFSRTPILESIPSQPNMVLAGDTEGGSGTFIRFEASSTILSQRAMAKTPRSVLNDLSITPDGSEVVIPAGGPRSHLVYRTSDLTLVHEYPSATAIASAVREDGAVAAGANDTDGLDEKDVYVFEAGGTTPIVTYQFGHLPDLETWEHRLSRFGVAWNGNWLYAVTKVASEPDNLTLRILDITAGT